ncbi:hypothetical protein LAWI1_G000617 [Lachnellula willkommii]|uniref:Uncharacterized protein n=1 Tax=Lachnellula willkommii TaxID=215461 RepID=A0A559MJB9_9HELO|nr:hypothetical protein LAWI1_G000617 [Lachnellula willkommii]
MSLIEYSKANLPNLRRLFVEARTDAEESAYSRNAVILQYGAIHVIGCCRQSRGSTDEQDYLTSNTRALLFEQFRDKLKQVWKGSFD